MFLPTRSCGEKYGFASSVLTSKVTTTEMAAEDVDMDDIEEETRQIMAEAAAQRDAEMDAEVTQVKVKVS